MSWALFIATITRRFATLHVYLLYVRIPTLVTHNHHNSHPTNSHTDGGGNVGCALCGRMATTVFFFMPLMLLQPLAPALTLSLFRGAGNAWYD